MGTTQAGGIYQKDDKFVDANGAPVKDARGGDDVVVNSDFDIEKANKNELIAEAGRRQIVVRRQDGKEPLKDDYKQALSQ